MIKSKKIKVGKRTDEIKKKMLYGKKKTDNIKINRYLSSYVDTYEKILAMYVPKIDDDNDFCYGDCKSYDEKELWWIDYKTDSKFTDWNKLIEHIRKELSL